MKFKTLFIDIGKVLVDFNYEVALSKISELSGLSVQALTERIRAHPDIARYESGQITTEKFFRNLSSTLQLDVPLAAFKEIWGSIFVFDGTTSIDLMSEELFQELKEKHQLVTLSNTNEMHFEYLARVHPFLTEFDDYVLSYQVGALKPDPQIYQCALDKVQRSSSEVLFIDDMIENVQAAQGLGIQGIVFDGEKELRRDLQDRGVL